MLVAQKESYISSSDKEKSTVEDDQGKSSDKTEGSHPPNVGPKVTQHERPLQKGTERNNPQLTTAAHHETISSKIRGNNVVHLRNGAEDDRQKRFQRRN